MGTSPHAPGIYRFQASMMCRRATFAARPCQPLSRRSGRFPALPYPPLRQRQFTLPAAESQISSQKSLPQHPLARYNYLVLGQFRWPVLG